MTEFDISSLYRQAFGASRGKPFDDAQIYQAGIQPAEPFPDSPALVESGGVFSVARNSLRSQMANGAPIFMPVQVGSLILPNEPSMSLSIRKNVVMTTLVGSTRKGTVKELVSTDDWYITLRGIIINDTNAFEYPEADVRAMYDLFQLNSSLKIESGLTNLLDIYRVVVLDFSLPEMMGSQHAQAYELKLVSDEDFDLEI